MLDRTLIIFTKDRIDRLEHVLPQLPVWLANVMILDDSLRADNRRAVADVSQRYGIEYHGPLDQKRLLHSLENNSLQSFVATLGTQKWSLGYNRNYALICSLLRGSRFLIMMDDDVGVRSPANVEAIFQQLGKSRFAAADIELMPDHSIVGHIYREAGIIHAQYASGTFLGIRLHQISHFFLNKYNEDWIWLSLENAGREVPHPTAVDQLPFDPFYDLDQRVTFQEEGEILWDGLSNLSSEPDYDRLIQLEYWMAILRQRKRVIEGLAHLQLDHVHRELALKVMHRLSKYHETIDPISFAKIWSDYYRRRREWIRILDYIKSWQP